MTGIEVGVIVAGIYAAMAAFLESYWVIVLYIVVAAASYFLTQEGDLPAYDTSPDAGIKVNARSTQERLPILYGQLQVGGNDVFIATSGENERHLWIVQTLSEGECEGFAQNESEQDELYLFDKHYSEFGGNVSYYFHSGTSDQNVNAELTAAYPQFTDCMRDTCYVVWDIWHDFNYFQGFPQKRNAVLKGKKLYDFRTETTEYSNNPVLCVYDYMRSDRYGQGYAASKFDIDSWTSAANYCDAKGWTCNMLVKNEESAQDVIDKILSLFRGAVTWYDGKFYMKYMDLNYEASVMTITDQHILRDDKGKAQTEQSQPTQWGKPDGLMVRWINPDTGYVVDTVSVGDEEGVINELDLTFCTNREQASNLGTYALERSNMDMGVTGTYKDECITLEPKDVITYNSTALNISDQMMRVETANINADGTISLTFAYEDEDLYDDDYNVGQEGTYDIDLPDFQADPPAVTNLAATEEQYAYRDRTYTKLQVSFDAPADYAWFSHAKVYISYDNINWLHLFDAGDNFEINPVEEGRKYYIRLKTVTIFGTQTHDNDDDAKISYTVQGHTDLPSSLTALYAVVNENAINLYANKVSDPDVKFYEFRLGTSWAGGVFLGAFHAPNMSLTGCKPGIHTFFCNTLGNNGLYGSDPVFATVELVEPPDTWGVVEIIEQNVSHKTRALVVYNSELYAAFYDGSLFERGDDGYWIKRVASTNEIINTLIVYDSKLYAGTNEGRLLEWNDVDTWVEKAPQYGSESIWVLAVYNNKLYAGASPGGRLLEWNDVDAWVEKAPQYGSEFIRALAVYNNKLYAGTSPGGRLLEWNDVDAWVEKAPTLPSESTIFGLVVYNNKLYGGTLESGKLYEWNDVDAWVSKTGAVAAGEDAFCALAVYNSKLYIGTGSYLYYQTGGFGKLYEWNDVDAWVEKAPQLGWETIYALLAHDGKLYAGSWPSGNILEWNDVDAWAVNTEAHNNTEAYLYGGEIYLKCSHTDDVLSGSYSSPIYDLGPSDRFMVYILAQVVVIGTGTEWDDQVPTPVTWDDIDADSKTWYQIFEPSAAVKVSISLRYGDTPALGNEVGMMEIISAIIEGRYFQVVIDIEDPTTEINALIENFQLRFCQQ